MDRDENAAVNILNRALNEVGLILSARGGFGNTQPLKRETLEGSPPHIAQAIDGG
jgi:putative transposase